MCCKLQKKKGEDEIDDQSLVCIIVQIETTGRCQSSISVNQSIPQLVDRVTAVLSAAQPEHAFDNADLGCSSVGTTESGEIVNHQSGTDQIRTTVDCSCNQRYLEERRKLILVLQRCSWVGERSLVRDGRVGTDEHVVADGLTEDFDFEDVGDDFFGFAVEVWVD